MGGPVMGSSDERSKNVLLFAGGLLATLAVVLGIVLLWPGGDDDDVDVSSERTTTTMAGDKDRETTTSVKDAKGEPSAQSSTTSTTVAPVETVPPPTDLFTSGAPAVLTDLAAAAGNPTQVLELVVYGDYAFLAYRDPANPGNIDRRMWRGGNVDDAEPNIIDDRVDADTEPKLFSPGGLDLGVLAQLTADAPGRFGIDVAVTHVIVNRFLPFDERILYRVYASPTDGRSGGGYVQYTLDGTFVKVVE